MKNKQIRKVILTPVRTALDYTIYFLLGILSKLGYFLLELIIIVFRFIFIPIFYRLGKMSHKFDEFTFKMVEKSKLNKRE